MVYRLHFCFCALNDAASILKYLPPNDVKVAISNEKSMPEARFVQGIQNRPLVSFNVISFYDVKHVVLVTDASFINIWSTLCSLTTVQKI